MHPGVGRLSPELPEEVVDIVDVVVVVVAGVAEAATERPDGVSAGEAKSDKKKIEGKLFMNYL